MTESTTTSPALDASKKGLIGGELSRLAEVSRVKAIQHPTVLAPHRIEGHIEALKDFISQKPLHVEVGFGRPHYILDLARQRKDCHVLGFEVQRRWVRAASVRATRESLSNIRVIEGDARPHLEAFFEEESVDAFHVLFPDPWWKAKHHKRRVFTPDFLAALKNRLRIGGHLFVKTDVAAYADLVLKACHEAGLTLSKVGSADPMLRDLPLSHREKKCAALSVPVFMFAFVRESSE